MPPQNQQFPQQPPVAGPIPPPTTPGQPQPPPARPPQPVDPNAPAEPYQFPAKPREAEESPYEFFMEPQKAGPAIGLRLGDSPGKKLFFIVGVIVAVLALLAIIIAITSKPSDSSLGLVAIAQDQQEIIRVAGDPVKNSHDDSLLNFAATAQVSLTSAQQTLVAYIAKTGSKVNDKTLALKQSAKTDQALSAAVAADTYDTTFESIMRSNLSTYAHDLDQEASTARSKTELQILQNDIAGVQLLQKMLPAPAQ